MRRPLLKKLTLCSIYSALAIISFVIENLFPPLFLPGARMGVSNVFILICLITLGPKYAVITLILKTTLGSIISGNAFAIVYSLPSGLIALVIETLSLYLMKKVSVLATSIVGAVVNTTFQNLTFCIITNTSEYLLYLPYLALIAVVSGMIIGFAVYLTIKKLPNEIFTSNLRD